MKYILLILCLILSAMIFYQFRYYSNNDFQVALGSKVSIDDLSIPAENKTLKSIRAYSEIIERPLFSKDRKPPAILSNDAADSIDIGELRDLTLYGVVISNDKRYAIIDNAGDGAEHIEIGHVFKGWNVSAINADSVKFESSKGQYELFISPNESDKKSGIKKSYRNNSQSSKASSKPELRSAIFKSTRKPAKSPIKIINKSTRNDAEEELSQEELDLLDKLGDEGSYTYDLDELYDEEDFEE
ncbi:MAG: hypothetical protein AB8B89_04895 [Gammaproteobacteria bacterium]